MPQAPPSYRHVLLATAVEAWEDPVALRARDLAARFGARLGLVHVVDYVPAEIPADLPEVPQPELPQLELEEELVGAARQRLEAFARRLNLTADGLWVEIGSVRHEILRIAEEERADLIVVGSRAHHGLAALLGSVAKGILQGAPCDVLAVRVVRSEER